MEIKNKLGRDIFGQGFLYRIINKNEIIDIDDLSDDQKRNGIKDKKKVYVKYDKGDKDGNRWFMKTPYYLNWNTKSVNWFRENSGKKASNARNKKSRLLF